MPTVRRTIRNCTRSSWTPTSGRRKWPGPRRPKDVQEGPPSSVFRSVVVRVALVRRQPESCFDGGSKVARVASSGIRGEVFVYQPVDRPINPVLNVLGKYQMPRHPGVGIVPNRGAHAGECSICPPYQGNI